MRDHLNQLLSNLIPIKESIEDAYICLIRNILPTAENTIPKTYLVIKNRTRGTWWNKEFKKRGKYSKGRVYEMQTRPNKLN